MLARIIPRSFNDLLLPDILKLLFGCVIGYTLCFTLIAFGMVSIINAYVDMNSTTGIAAHVVGHFLIVTIAWFFFPLLYPVLISFFIDYIARVVEEADYPQLPKVTVPFWSSIRQDLKFSLILIGLNILCLPLYFIPLVNIFVYYGLNGYLFGRQFFRMAARRRSTKPEIDAMLRDKQGLFFGLGALTVFSATIPLIGLISPILAIAIMLHLYHELKGTNRTTILLPD